MSDNKIDLLCFAAHPDDAELSCGGLLALMSEQGYRVGLVDFSLGELSSRGNIETRKLEANAASEILGLTHRENLEFPDGFSSLAKPNEDYLKKIVLLLRRLRPEVVLSPYWQERHPDHIAASNLIDKAIFFSSLTKFLVPENNPVFTPRQVVYYQQRYEFKPSFIVDISAVVEKKIRAIECYQSQLGLQGQTHLIDTKQPQTLLSSANTRSSIEGRDRHYGSMIGTSYGEAFLLRNFPAIIDPIKHFRENQLNPPLFYPHSV